MAYATQKRLGKTQHAVLDGLRRHREWWAGCGWVWDTHSGTAKVLDSLVRRGEVEKVTEIRAGATRDVYRLARRYQH